MAAGSEEEQDKLVVKLNEHPSLVGAQEALRAELSRKKEDLRDRVREKQVLLASATRRREEVGVQLYGLQKTLASIHIAVTKTEDVLAARVEEQEKAKAQLLDAQVSYKDRWSEMNAMQDKLEACHIDLDNLASTLKQVDSYNDKLKSDIAVSRRATYAMEEIISKAEKGKKDQDFYIAVQQERLRRYYQRQALCRAQFEAQQRETKMAVAALSEFGIEMESINTEKKQLTDQWKSALIVLGRCDEALQPALAAWSSQALVDAASKQREQDLSIQGEKHRYRKDIRLERDKGDTKLALLKKYGSQIKHLNKRITKVAAKRNTVLQKYAAMMLTMEETERSEVKVIEKAYLKQCQTINDLETKMLVGLSEQITLERSAQQVVQGTLQLRQEIRHEHMMATEIEYELARIRVDTLTVQSYNQTISDALASLDDEVQQKMSLISKMQAETRQRHSEIDVKTKEIDKLNKQYDKLTANLVDKSATPFENIVANIRYEIAVKIRASSELQKQWLGIQTELVSITTENHALAQKGRKLDKDRITLEQRKLRLEKDLGTLTKYIKDVDKNVQMKHGIVTNMKEMLTKENLLLKNSNDLAIQELQQEALRIEYLREDCNLEKSDAALLQAMMSPSAILGAMKKEYERLKWELNALNIQKEKLVAEVQTRASNSRKETAHEPDAPEALLTKACMELKRNIREVNADASAVDEKMVRLQSQLQTHADKHVEIDNAITAIQQEQEALRSRLVAARPVKSFKVLATAIHHRMVKRHQDLQANKWKVAIKVDLDTDWEEARKKAGILTEVLLSFQDDLPMLWSKFDTMLVQLRLALEI
ncbi:coiled-coil domain-containing protein 40-like [Selaginella moellendorffii]|uniref:coiled-coil domain-containing protein 40-like n=1 Tax=Selaginella moellendorffii TaxID=88036 RepID=UPI000D1C8D0B|nr:coiled-coil domain-containing protein 40-like [Selaginella moellendorffii]|eukprot:XP_024543454.1 coiled-coil domain-containing protein 40-like [Selaginella moellendorffii]